MALANPMGSLGSLFQFQRLTGQKGQSTIPQGAVPGQPGTQIQGQPSQAVQQQFAQQQSNFAGGLSQAAVNTGQAAPQTQGLTSTETPLAKTRVPTSKRKKKIPLAGGSQQRLSQMAVA